jgi:hypothetical protein
MQTTIERTPIVLRRDDAPETNTARTRVTSVRLAYIIALTASLGFASAGSYAMLRGFDARDQVRAELAAEQIVTPEDAAIPNAPVVSAETAKAQADVIRVHMLEATGGKTYAEMDREDPLREVAFSASALRTALLSSVLAFNTATLVIGFGAFIASIGVLGLALLFLLRSKFRTE